MSCTHALIYGCMAPRDKSIKREREVAEYFNPYLNDSHGESSFFGKLLSDMSGGLGGL
jgi:hypothetical protein